MQISYSIDLSRYTDNEVAMFFVQGIISRREFEQWREIKRQEEQAKLYGNPTAKERDTHQSQWGKTSSSEREVVATFA